MKIKVNEFQTQWVRRRSELLGLIWRTAILAGLLYWCWGKTGTLIEECQPWDPSCRAMGYFDRVNAIIGWASLIFIGIKLRLMINHVMALAAAAVRR